MEIEYIIYVTLEDGNEQEIIMWADEDSNSNELSAMAHEKVMNKFGGYSEFRVEPYKERDMKSANMKDLVLKGKWFQTKDLHTLIIRVQDFFNIDLGDLQDQLFELEDIAYKNNPKKPTPYGDDTNFRCPNCTRTMLTSNNKQSYCMYCGQALEWEN